jgi:transposase
MRSKLEPMKRVARMLRGHRGLLLNGFRAKGPLSSGVVEGFNTKAKLTTRKAFGFRTYHALQIALGAVLLERRQINRLERERLGREGAPW